MVDRNRFLTLSALLGGVAATLVYHSVGAAVVAIVLFVAGAAILLQSVLLVVRGAGPRTRPVALAILACGSLCYGLQMLPALPFPARMAALACGTFCLLASILIARMARAVDPRRF